MDRAERLESFFLALTLSEEGRGVLSEGEESFHLRLGPDHGVMAFVIGDGVRASVEDPEVAPAEDLTRLEIPDERTFERIVAGMTSFWQAVIPMSEEHGAILFVDNWMLKKGAINRFGRMVRLAQEARGLRAAEESVVGGGGVSK